MIKETKIINTFIAFDFLGKEMGLIKTIASKKVVNDMVKEECKDIEELARKLNAEGYPSWS